MAASIEFPFLLEELEGLNVETKTMFGARGIYVDGKIVFIMRDRSTSTEDNGVWLATTAEHHESLLSDFPSMRSIAVFGPGPTGWQVLPLDSEDFEESVLRACHFVRGGDTRIGKIPAAKRLSKKKATKKNSVQRKLSVKPKQKAVTKPKPKRIKPVRTKPAKKR